MKSYWASIGVLLACLLISSSCSVSWGQTLSTSQISGTVTDVSGAAIANAQIQLTDVEKGLIHKAVSNGTGYYVLPDLPAGQYTIQVSSAGFQTYLQKNIQIEVGVSPQINVKMNVGEVTSQVVVESNSAQVETASTGVGQVIDRAQVVDLPLNGRDPDQLIQLAGAATTAVGGDLNSNKNFPTIAIAVAGGLPNMVNFVLDGGIHNEVTNGLNMPQPMPDSLQEFKVETSSLPAQYGDHASAAINAITRSGTNKLHGDAFEFIRNYVFNAQNFFANRLSPTYKYKDGLKRNQFGGTIGGPIIKDRLFFFGGFQDTIIRSLPNNNYAQVPTMAMMLGDFSTVTSAACGKTVTLSGPNVSAGNQMNPANFSSQALAVMKFIPYALPAGTTAPASLQGYPSLPDASSAAAGFSANCGYVQTSIPANSRQDNAIGRVDWTLNPKNSVFARYFLGINNQPIPADKDALNVQAVDQYNRDHGITVGDTYVFNANLINALRLTANRVVNLRVVQPFFDPSTLGIAQYNAIPGYIGMTITGGFSVGGGTTNPGHFNSTAWQAVDDVNYIHGNHEFGFGADYVYGIMDTVNTRPTNGSYTFSGAEYSGNASYGYSDFFQGGVDSFSQGLQDLENDGQTRIALYAQDSWKVTKRLTINYGIRWQPFLAEHNSNDHVQNFSMAAFAAGQKSTVFVNGPAGLLFDGDPGMPGNHYTRNSDDLFDPRFGLIWDPFGDGKTSVRASFGTFHDSPQMFFNTRYSNSPPFGSTVSINNVSFANPWATYPGGDPFPALDTISKTETFPLEGIYVNSPLNIRIMDLEQWNLSVQRQAGTWLFSATYLGNRTVHLPTSYEADPALYAPGTWNGVTGSGSNCVTTIGSYTFTPPKGGACSTTGDYNQRRLLILQNPAQGQYYSTIGQYDPEGIADYNGMLISVQRRVKNLNIVANYTWSHCLSELETTELTGPSYQINPIYDPNGRRASYSNCDSDHRQVANVSMVLLSPGIGSHLAKTFTADWQLSPVFTAATGGFSTVNTGVDNALAGSGNGYAYNPANPYGARTNFGTHGYLSSSGWTAAPTGSFSYQRPNTIVGPNTYELDMGLVRTFHVYHTDSQNVQFRWEVFNVPNEAILGGTSTTFGDGFNGTGAGIAAANLATTSGTFGNFTTAGNPRQMQFALKYNF